MLTAKWQRTRLSAVAHHGFVWQLASCCTYGGWRLGASLLGVWSLWHLPIQVDGVCFCGVYVESLNVGHSHPSAFVRAIAQMFMVSSDVAGGIGYLLSHLF